MTENPYPYSKFGEINMTLYKAWNEGYNQAIEDVKEIIFDVMVYPSTGQRIVKMDESELEALRKKED